MKLNLKLKHKMVISILCLAIIPLLIYGVINFYRERRIINDNIMDNKIDSVQQVTREAENRLFEKKNLLKVATLAEDINLENNTEQNELFESIVEDYDYFEAIAVIDETEEAIKSRAFLQNLLEEEKEYAINIKNSIWSEEEVINISIPLNGEDSKGILVAEVNLDLLSGIVSDLKEVGEVYLTDLDTDFSINMLNLERTDLEEIDKVLNFDNQSDIFYDEAGNEKLGVSGFFDELNLAIIYQGEVADVFAASDNGFLNRIFLFLLISIIIGLIALFISDKISKPLIKAIDFAEEITDGNLNLDPLDIQIKMEEIIDLDKQVDGVSDKNLIAITKMIEKIIRDFPEEDLSFELKKLANDINIPEIHVVNEAGYISASNVDDFINFDFSQSDQTKPFLPGIKDKKFTLVQEPRKRGTDGKLFQYVGVARQDKAGVIQIGAEPAELKRLSEELNVTGLARNIRQDEVSNLASALNQMQVQLKEMIISISENVDNLSSYSEELSATAEESNASVEQTKNAFVEMADNITNLLAGIKEVKNFTEQANQQTQAGEDKVANTMESMERITKSVDEAVVNIQELNTAFQEINKVVDLIDNIAEQTNLLALNASIEAARAGKSGESFAVVAEEIRSLSEKTSKSTNTIDNLIVGVKNKVKDSLEVIEEVKEETKTGEERVIGTKEVFLDIRENSKELVSKVEKSTKSAKTLSQNSNQIEQSAQEIAAMSDEVASSAQSLARMSQKLKELIKEFEL